MNLSDEQRKLFPKIQDSILKILNDEHCPRDKDNSLYVDFGKCPKSDDGDALDCDYCKAQHILRIKGIVILPKDYKIVYGKTDE